MKTRVVRSKQERIDKATIICELYSKRKYSIASCCRVVDVSYDTFKDWAQVWLNEEDIKLGNHRPGFIPEVHSLYKKTIQGGGKLHWEYLIKNKVREGLLLRAGVFQYEDITTKVVLDKKGSVDYTLITKRTKVALPDIKALIYLYKSLAPIQ